MKIKFRHVLIGTLGLLVVTLLTAILILLPESEGDPLSLDQLDQLIQTRQVRRAVFLDEDARLIIDRRVDAIANGSDLGVSSGPAASGSRLYWSAYPRNDATASRLIERLSSAGATVEVDAQSGKAVVRLLATTLLPVLILANLFALLFTAGKDDGSAVAEVTAFGKSESSNPIEAPSVTFANVAGANEAVVELQEVVDYLKNPGKYQALGAVPPKGVLLFGPPGCGKTLLARAVAGEAGVNFFSASGAEFVESLVGVGAARVRDLFARARAASPAIVFIDEIDAAGRRRGGSGGGGSEEREQTLIQMLVELDGFAASAGLVVIAATNRPDILDPALLRPGRFDRHVTVERPDIERRQSILALHVKKRPIAADVDFSLIAKQTPGFTGADLANVVNEAVLLTIRAGRSQLDAAAFSEAVQRVIGGPKRGGQLLNEEERRRVAYHEAGHAVVSAAEGRAKDVHRLSVVARSRGLGAALLQREEAAAVMTLSDLEARLSTLFAGREAERLVFGNSSTGVENDLAQATHLARDIVGRYALTDSFDGMRLLDEGGDEHLGGHAGIGPISGATLAACDLEIRALLRLAASRSRSHLERYRDTVKQLADTLLEKESLEGSVIQSLLLPVMTSARETPVHT